MNKLNILTFIANGVTNQHQSKPKSLKKKMSFTEEYHYELLMLSSFVLGLIIMYLAFTLIPSSMVVYDGL